jgi:hypothetical protein
MERSNRNNKDYKILAIQQGQLCPNLKYLKSNYFKKALGFKFAYAALYCFYFEIFIKINTFAPSCPDSNRDLHTFCQEKV